jgi:hypothetical protein
LLWGGWLLVTGLVFSYMQGIIHPYYMVALAPAIGALVGVGAIALPRPDLPAIGRAVAAAGILGTGIWAYALLDRTPTWLPWLRWTVLVAGLLGAAAMFAVPALTARATRRGSTVQAGGTAEAGRTAEAGGITQGGGTVQDDGTAHGGTAHSGGPARRAPLLAYAPLALALVAGLGGPLAYSLDTANTTHTGAIPSAGPAVAGTFGGAPGGTGGPGGGTGGGTGGRFPGGRPGTGTGTGAQGSAAGTGSNGTRGAGGTGGPGGAGGAGGAGGGGMGGLSGSTQVSSALIKLLEQDASRYKWIAATEGSQSAAPIELATGGDAVMAIGGFNGTDPTPTLAQFEATVAKHEVHYYVGESNNSFGGGSGSSAITSWVAAHFKSQAVGGVTVYNLTQQK